MLEDITVNGKPVLFVVSHITEPGEGWKASRTIDFCHTISEVNKLLNDPSKQPEPYWVWKIDFMDKDDDV